MEPPLTVEVPTFRQGLVPILAYWADRTVQERQWIRQDREEPFWDTLWEQVNDFETYTFAPPSTADRIGNVLTGPDEARRVQSMEDRLDRLLELDSVQSDKPETYFNLPLWHDVNRKSQAAVNLIVMDGACWIEGDETVNEDTDLVSEYPRRALAAQCLASLADCDADDLDEQPPLRRDFDDATCTLVDRCALSDPQSAIERIYRDGDEIPRLQRLHEAIQRDASKIDIAALAGHALTAVVRAGFGWNYDGPIDATTQ